MIATLSKRRDSDSGGCRLKDCRHEDTKNIRQDKQDFQDFKGSISLAEPTGSKGEGISLNEIKSYQRFYTTRLHRSKNDQNAKDQDVESVEAVKTVKDVEIAEVVEGGEAVETKSKEVEREKRIIRN